MPEVLEKDLVSIREVLVALQGEREKNASELTRMLDEREGLQEYIARLEEANRSVCERHPFPREAVRDIFRRMNPKVENLKKEEVLTLLEALWNRNVVSREEER